MRKNHQEVQHSDEFPLDHTCPWGSRLPISLPPFVMASPLFQQPWWAGPTDHLFSSPSNRAQPPQPGASAGSQLPAGQYHRALCPSPFLLPSSSKWKEQLKLTIESQFTRHFLFSHEPNHSECLVGQGSSLAFLRRETGWRKSSMSSHFSLGWSTTCWTLRFHICKKKVVNWELLRTALVLRICVWKYESKILNS